MISYNISAVIKEKYNASHWFFPGVQTLSKPQIPYIHICGLFLVCASVRDKYR